MSPSSADTEFIAPRHSLLKEDWPYSPVICIRIVYFKLLKTDNQTVSASI